MRILVCVKQVPGTTKVEVDEKTGVLRRDGIGGSRSIRKEMQLMRQLREVMPIRSSEDHRAEG